jgi:hypothetical protein
MVGLPKSSSLYISLKNRYKSIVLPNRNSIDFISIFRLVYKDKA